MELDRFVVHRSHDFGLEDAAHLRRRRRHRLRPHRRPARLRLLAGLHRLRRLAQRGVRREDLQGDGPRGAERRAGDRPQRLGRRAHPGRRRVARRLRRDLPAQHARLGGGAADQRDPRPVRRRRGVLAGHHRLHLHGAEVELHVRHRPQRREDGDARGRDDGGARAAPTRTPQVSGVAHFAHDSEPACLQAIRDLFRFIPQQQPRRAAARRAAPIRATAATRRCSTSCPTTRTSRTTCTTSSGASSTTASSTRCSPTSRRTSSAASRTSAATAWASSPTSRRVLAGRARHQRVDQGGAVHPLLRRVQHPARDVRGRARLPARRGAGARRHHPPRRQAAVRLLRGHRAQAHRHHAQGVRRRVRRHELQAHPRRLQSSPGPRRRSP